MNRLEILRIVTNREFNNCEADIDITKAWGYYIYVTGEAISREEFVDGVAGAHKLLSTIR